MIGGMIIFMMIVAIMIIGFSLHLIGGILKWVLRLVIGLPFAILCTVFGLLLCCTVICIPLGIGCFKLAGWVFSPFKFGVC